jgi:hypothetical protein
MYSFMLQYANYARVPAHFVVKVSFENTLYPTLPDVPYPTVDSKGDPTCYGSAYAVWWCNRLRPTQEIRRRNHCQRGRNHRNRWLGVYAFSLSSGLLI